MRPVIVGHAIVSDDDRIADARRSMPDALRNDADWRRFQSALDASDLIALGRLGHEAHPNPGRRRLVLSSRGEGIEARADAFWWNPARAAWSDVVDVVFGPAPGWSRPPIVAVTGGRDVFDLFGAIGYDAFHLVRAQGVRLPGGVGLFAACEASGETAETRLTALGLTPAARETLDPEAGVVATLWSRGAG